MANLTFVHRHELGLVVARERTTKLAQELADSYRVKSHWEADVLVFSRPGVKGQILVTETTIELDARLGPLLAAFKPKIEAQLNQNFDGYFG